MAQFTLTTDAVEQAVISAIGKKPIGYVIRQSHSTQSVYVSLNLGGHKYSLRFSNHGSKNHHGKQVRVFYSTNTTGVTQIVRGAIQRLEFIHKRRRMDELFRAIQPISTTA